MRRGRSCSWSTRRCRAIWNKNFDDYRKKELFEFRPFYLAKLRAVLDAPGGPKTYEFEKQKPAKPADPETWKVTRVGGSSHTADQTAMDDLLNKLVAIKAESFVDAKTRTGLDKPALVVSASFDEGKFERVRFGQVGESRLRRARRRSRHREDRPALDARRAAGLRFRGDAEGADAGSERGREEVSAERRGSRTGALVIFVPQRLRAEDRGAGHRAAGRRARPLPKNSCAAISRRSSPTAPSITRSGRCRCNRSSRASTLYSLNPSRMQTPASNQKLITSAVAADRLGWDYRYTTKIYTTGTLSEAAISTATWSIVSNGDPTINPRHPDRWGAFDAWAKELYAKGIRRVGGHLIGDDNAFAEPGYGFGWAWDDLVTGYGAAVGALQYNENQIELLIWPGLEAGARAIISVVAPGQRHAPRSRRHHRRGGTTDPHHR